MEKSEKLKLQKKHSFENFSNRKHYNGLHRIEVIINGNSITGEDFELVV